jgi:ABC-type phosphate/phosphonate transport system substrate-binding protein
MYVWPENTAENDALWARMAAFLRDAGLAAPASLSSGNDLEALWLSPHLMLAQTCTYPLETVLKGRVAYVATPTYAVPGCETPGHYRSVIIRRGAGSDAPVPEDRGPALPAWDARETIAFNGFDSMSGWHGLARDAEAAGWAMPQGRLQTGAHRASIRAVAAGDADTAAIDCVSWAMAKRFEPAARTVRAIGWTGARPGLPLITRIDCPQAEMAILREAARLHLGAVVLDPPVERP